MNFAKLLAAGRSIINSGGSVTYRENKSVYLPNFGPPKNPFAKNEPEAAAEAAPAPAPATAPKPAKLSVVVPAAARPAEPTRTAHWPASLNPLTMFKGTHGTPVRPVKAEQTELRLSEVRVVGNDLSDADVDAVPPLKSRPARKKGPAQPAEQWGEVENGVLGANLV